jgi:hypothetical protein
MEQRIEHEFSGEEEMTLASLSAGLWRFSIMLGVVGLALAALGLAAMHMKIYGSTLAGPSLIALGAIAAFGGIVFVRPRVHLDAIQLLRGSDITRLMHALEYLDAAHRVLRLLLLAFVVVRVAAFLLVHMA